jgi:nuclear control of ATPase protein 2
MDLLLHIVQLFRESGPRQLSVQSIKEFFTTTVHPIAVRSILYPHLQNIRRPSMFSINSPLQWTRQECTFKRRELEKLRNDRAGILGELTELRQSLDALLSESGEEGSMDDKFAWLMMRISSILLQKESPEDLASLPDETMRMPMLMNNLAFKSLSSVNVLHRQQLEALSRPNWLVLLWPKLVFLPLAGIWLMRYLYHSRGSIRQTLNGIQETLAGFWNGWIVSPIREILNTVRTGGDASMAIISKDSLQAEMAVSALLLYMGDISTNYI